jgi:RNA polymerase sigma-70 factor (ECF subfamily)
MLAIASYYDEVVKYLSVFDISSELKLDAVHDTMAEALANANKLRNLDKAKPWLLTIAKRTGFKYIKAYRKISNYRCTLDDIIETEGVSDKNLSKIIESSESELLCKCLDKLKEKEKNLLLLHYVYNHKLKDAAKIIGETESNARSIAHRARIKLRAMLEENEID